MCYWLGSLAGSNLTHIDLGYTGIGSNHETNPLQYITHSDNLGNLQTLDLRGNRLSEISYNALLTSTLKNLRLLVLSRRFVPGETSELLREKFGERVIRYV